MTVLIVRIQIVNTLGIKQDYILVVFFFVWLLKNTCEIFLHLNRKTCPFRKPNDSHMFIDQTAPSIPITSISYFQSTCLKVCTRDSCQYQAYSTARLLTLRRKVLPSFPTLHTTVQKQKLETTSLPYTCTKIKQKKYCWQ